MEAVSQTNLKPRRPKRSFILALKMLLLCAGCLIITTFLLPELPTVMAKIQIQANSTRYDEVVRMIQTGTIPGGSPNGDNVLLPSTYRNLSPGRNGQVFVYQNGTRQQVLFYLSNDSIFPTWVYMYSSQEVSLNDFQGECSDLERERSNWYLFHCP